MVLQALDNGNNQKFLSWLVTFLLMFCVFISGWSKFQSSDNAKEISEMKQDLPEKFVRLERYKCDIASIIAAQKEGDEAITKRLDSIQALLNSKLGKR